jgi:phosphatidate phosphatase APP1
VVVSALMKNTLLVLSLILISASSLAGVTIVSDLDDTIKITNSGKLRYGVWRSLLTKQVFAGLPEFFQASKEYVNDLYVISASPKRIRPVVKNTLDENKIDFSDIILKNYLKEEKKLDYKVRSILGLMAKSQDKFILMGDDVELDPEVYEKVRTLHPKRVLAIYIHVVRNRAVPSSSTLYYTTADVAILENLAGRLSREGVRTVIEGVVNADEVDDIIPGFAYCPTTSTPWAWHGRTEFSKDAAPLTRKLVDFCLQR